MTGSLKKQIGKEHLHFEGGAIVAVIVL